MGLLQKSATWGRQLTQYQCFHSLPVLPLLLCFTGREGVVVVVGQGLNEVQAHPPNAGKVTVFPELHDQTVFLFEEPHLSAQEQEEVLY